MKYILGLYLLTDGNKVRALGSYDGGGGKKQRISHIALGATTI